MSTNTDSTPAGRYNARLKADYERALAAEPRLAELDWAADRHDGTAQQAWADLKYRVAGLVGWNRRDKSDPWLCSMAAYDAATHHVLDRVESNRRAERNAKRGK